MEMPAAARINTTRVNATGHDILAEFDIRRWAFSGGRFTFVPKKVPPPTPDGREGRLFPPEQSSKTSRLLNELRADGNNFMQKSFDPFPQSSRRVKHTRNQLSKEINK